MLYRSRVIALLLPLVTLAACADDTTGPGSTTTATVQFANATNTAIDARNAGSTATGAGNLAFGGASSCMRVDATGASGTGLTFSPAGSTTTLPGFAQTFTAGGNYTIIAYPSPAGVTQFLTIDNNTSAFIPTAGTSGVRIFNAASGSGSLVATRTGGTALNAGGTVYGATSSYASVPSGTQSFTFTSGTGTTVVTNAANLNLASGQNYTIVVAPAAPGSTTLRTFVFGGC